MRPHPNFRIKSRHSAAFTLVELSVVLVIIGLLVGGILGGQSLIRSAELKSVLTDFSKYRGAVFQFKDQYKGLPGDLSDAQDYWGVAAAGAACATTIGAGTSTCNGDGDGNIIPITGSDENIRFWQHLANAGFIDGNYSGVTANGVAASNATDKTNAPSGKISSSIWFDYTWATLTSSAGSFDGFYGTSFVLGKQTAGSWPTSALFSPEDTYGIDRKIDDGKPGTGSVVSNNDNNCTNASSTSDITTDYKLTTTSVACRLVFRNIDQR